MNLKRSEMLSYLDTLPVIDAHEHLRGFSDGCGETGVMKFLTQNYVRDFVLDVDLSLGKKAMDTKLSEEERFAAFVKMWPFFRDTGYGRTISISLAEMGVSAELTPDSFAEIEGELELHSSKQNSRLFEKAGIKKTLTHVVGIGEYGYLSSIEDFLSGKLVFDEGFYPLLGIIPLCEHSDAETVEKLGRIAQIKIGSLSDFTAAITNIFRRCMEAGIVGLKSAHAYTLGFDSEPAKKECAQRELRELLDGNKTAGIQRNLATYLFEELVSLAGIEKIPVALHTGYLFSAANARSNVILLEQLFRRFPEVKFDMYHLNYPYFDDLLTVMKSYHNVYANCCWTHTIDPAYTVRFLESALGALPCNRILGFGGDYILYPQLAPAHLSIAKQNIAEVLCNAVESGNIDTQRAHFIAKRWLYDNAAELYEL